MDVSGFASRTRYGPMNLGSSFAALPLGSAKSFVDKYTLSPLLIDGSSHRCLSACLFMNTRCCSIESNASLTFCTAVFTNSSMPLFFTNSGVTLFMNCGIRVYTSSKGANPVDSLILEFIANSTSGIFRLIWRNNCP